MLAKPQPSLPDGFGWAYEPKWDGFRAIVFRAGDDLLVQSRDLRPLDRYFPELEAPLKAALPERAVVDGEIVIAGPRGLDFDALLLRIHPAESRVRLLSAQTRTAAGSGKRDASTRAHLLEAAGTLDEALKAPMGRQGV